ncbi:MAG: Maf family protein [Desulfovermiculus sp.]|nr:Maf family protein [Desulfovermiculus sp.]
MSIHENLLQTQGPFRPSKPIVLASASPRRQALLTGLGICFHVQACHLSEPNPTPGESAREYVRRMAEFKARAVAKQKMPGVILAADTVVVVGEEILGKPKSVPQALDMLTSLNACTHSVLTGCCLVDQSTQSAGKQEFAVCTQVTFSRHSSDILTAYARTGEPMGKAGGYAIQGIGAFLVSHIHGSYSNVVGLPLSQTVQALLDMQAITLCDES